MGEATHSSSSDFRIHKIAEMTVGQKCRFYGLATLNRDEENYGIGSLGP
jgi:hypothetical protein